jgi:hypothetical protein
MPEIIRRVQSDRIKLNTKHVDTIKSQGFITQAIQTNYKARIKAFPQVVGLVRVHDTRRSFIDHFIGYSQKIPSRRFTTAQFNKAKLEVLDMAIAKFINVYGLAKKSGDIEAIILDIRFQYWTKKQLRKMNFEKGMRRLKGKLKQNKIFGFDIETCNNNKDFVCASVIGDNYQKFFTSKEELKKEICNNRIFRNSFICATNLMFDFFGVYSLNEAINKFQLIERSSSLIMAVSYIPYIKKNFTESQYKKSVLNLMKKNKMIKEIGKEFYKITFIDSGNHLKMSVKQLGEIIGLEKLDIGEMIGQKPISSDEWDLMKKYNLRDAEITYKFMKFLQDKYNNIGCNMKITVSSTALDLFRRKYLEQFWKQEPRELINKCYKSYYGGRTEAFKRGLFSSENYGKIKVYDVNSLYPYCLKNFEYPIPNKYRLSKKLSIEDVEDFEGIGYFKLKIDDSLNIPVLPMKTDKLRFMTGEVEGYYDFASIRLALNNDYEIIECSDGVVYEHKFCPFKTMINDLYKMRCQMKVQNDNTEIAVKLLMNSFYGKMAYNYKEKETLGNIDDINMADEYTSIIPTRDKKVFRLITSDNSEIPSYVFPIIPLYVTAYARQVMYKFFKRTGFKRVFYSDTDCIFTDRNLSHSKELGDLKLEDVYNELLIIKPKFYGGVAKDKENIKVKGLHGSIKEYEIFKKLVADDSFNVKTRHFRKLRGSIGHDDKYVNEIYTMMKSLDLEDDKRLWEKNKFTLNPQNSIPINHKI